MWGTRFLLLLVGAAIQGWGGEVPRLPTVTEHNVNGYRVLLINQHRGNAVDLSVEVETGQMHDGPNQAGLAHLWEHVIYRSNQKYSLEELQKLEFRFGGLANATTELNRTRHFCSGHAESLPEMIEYLGTIITLPAWDIHAFETEKKVVMHEAQQYQENMAYLLDNGMLMALTPENHPFGIFPLGSQEQLAKVKIQDLQDLYYSNYRPENTTIIVTGNFDGTEGSSLQTQNILNKIREHFSPQSVYSQIEPNSKKVFPSIIPVSQNERIVEISTDRASNLFQLLFELPGGKAFELDDSLSILFQYLNLGVGNSFLDMTKRLGWANDGRVSRETINNSYIAYINFDLTDLGFKNRHKIPELFLKFLASVRSNGIPEDVFAFIKRKWIIRLKERLLSTKDTSALVSESLKRFSYAQDIFNFDQRASKVTLDSLKQAASLFDADKAILGYTGRKIYSSKKLPVFKSSYVMVPSAKFVQRWKDAQTRPISLSLAKPQMDDSSFPTSNIPTSPIRRPAYKIPMQSSELFLKEDHRTNLGALVLEFQARNFNLETEVMRGIVNNAFVQRYEAEFEAISNQSVDILTDSVNGLWKLYASGNPEAARRALKWVAERLQAFKPTKEELIAGKELLIAELEGHQESPAEQARSAAKKIFSISNPQKRDLLKIAFEIRPERILESWKTDLNQVDLRIICYGHFFRSDIARFGSELEALFPRVLPEKTRAAIDRRRSNVRKLSARNWILPKGLEEKNVFGVSKTIQGPSTGGELGSRMMVLEKILDEMIFSENRSRRGLGYMHGASLFVSHLRYHLVFYGETSNLERKHEIEDGWKLIEAQLRDGKVPASDFTPHLIATKRALSLLPEFPMEGLNRLEEALDIFDDPNGFDKLLLKLEEVSTDDLAKAAKKIISRKSTSVFVSHEKPKNCREVL